MSIVKTANLTGEVATIVSEIEAIAAKRGLTVSRWATRKGQYTLKITYVVHSGERAHASAAQDGSVADTWFMDREGTTKACRAYRCLAAMKRELEAATE